MRRSESELWESGTSLVAGIDEAGRGPLLIVLDGSWAGATRWPDKIRLLDAQLTEAGRTDPVISTFAATQRVFQWHEDGISLPEGADHLASSPASPVQAFRFGEHAYGFQFHLEVDASLVERWLTVADNQPLLAEEAGRVDPQRWRRQV